jgi:hypothetical protein
MAAGRINPAKVAPGELSYVVVDLFKGTTIVVGGAGNDWAGVGETKKFHADQSGRDMGLGSIVGKFNATESEGKVPLQSLPLYVLK